MALNEDLQAAVKEIFSKQWTQRDGKVVPEPEDLKLGNDAVNLDATVLYADISGSTKLVDSQEAFFAAEIYKTYLACAARIIKDQSGVITAYDGDRVMGVFVEGTKNTNAATAALKINGAVQEIIQPALNAQYPNRPYVLRHVVGVDTSKLFVGRIGVRSDNDLVWVGRAANYAAKLSTLNNYSAYITAAVFEAMRDPAKYGGSNNECMWTKLAWTSMDNMTIYGSRWHWTP